MFALDGQAGTNGPLAPRHEPTFVLLARLQELPVERVHVLRFRHGHPMVPPKIPDLSLNAALFMGLGRRAKLRLKSPVRTEGNKPGRLFPSRSSQDLPYRRAQVVVPKLSKYPPKVSECQLMRFQKRLLGRMPVGAVKRRSAGHAAHREHL